ncbi:MAG: hypothetical protein HY390_03190 [Deltaproteobacteria bacterium]|nr:hypothetical protein [Deltaproteobacteria bacterium]
MKCLISLGFMFLCLVSMSDGIYAQETPKDMPLHVTGTGNIRFSSVFLPKETVQGLLPDGLELAVPPLTPAGLHPVTFLFESLYDFSFHSPLHDFVLIPHYEEVILAIGYVKKIGEPKVYVIFPKIYLNSIRATAAGFFYGFKKQLAHIEDEGDLFYVGNSWGQPLMEAEFSEVPSYDEVQFEQNFLNLKKMLLLPVIGVQAGQFICSQFEWDFEHAERYPVETDWQIFGAYRPYLEGSYFSEGLHKNPWGSVFMNIRAWLSPPKACHP